MKGQISVNAVLACIGMLILLFVSAGVALMMNDWIAEHSDNPEVKEQAHQNAQTITLLASLIAWLFDPSDLIIKAILALIIGLAGLWAGNALFGGGRR